MAPVAPVTRHRRPSGGIPVAGPSGPPSSDGAQNQEVRPAQHGAGVRHQPTIDLRPCDVLTVRGPLGDRQDVAADILRTIGESGGRSADQSARSLPHAC